MRGPAVTVEMRSHILDHAEALFALHGLHGVTVRDIARSAAVDSALVHYYFDSFIWKVRRLEVQHAL